MAAPIPFSEYKDKKYNYLTIISEVGRNKNSHRLVVTLCDCGKIKTILLYQILSGNTMSCGCYNKKIISEQGVKHNMCKHPLYNTWNGMKERCNNPKAHNFKWYGGIGVKVCEEWINDFISFKDWAFANGWEHGLQLDKDIIAKKLGIPPLLYSPNTCCFVTSLKNNTSKEDTIRLTYNGEEKTISEWSKVTGISYKTIHKRYFVLKLSIVDTFNPKMSKGGGSMSGRGFAGKDIMEIILQYKREGKSAKEICLLTGCKTEKYLSQVIWKYKKKNNIQ